MRKTIPFTIALKKYLGINQTKEIKKTSTMKIIKPQRN
jgi:hypothetical protein